MAERAAEGDPLIGTEVGDYRITGVLGQGDMAIVYAAEHLTLGHRTACKVLRPEFMRQKDAVARFLLEAQKVSKIRHPNLIDIFDSGELADGRLYYVMEYLAGRPLSQVAAEGRLPFAEIVHIGRQVCAGLAAAHAADLVHRDLSPDNLFLCERPGTAALVKIMDFGVAKVVTAESSQLRLTRRGALIGTPSYMAPEQITEEPVDARTDVYALGAILFELCTGQVPFAGSLSEVLSGHLRAPVPRLPPAVRKGDVPAGMQAVVDKAMAKAPADRYASAAALGEALEQLWRPSGGRPRRVQLAVAAAATVAMLLVVGGGVYLGKRGRSAPEEALDMQALRALALTTLQQGLADPDAEVRRQAVEALGRSHDARHEDLLAPRLRDADPAVQLAAARAVGELGNRAAVAPLQQRLADQSPPELLATGGEALLHLGEPGGREPLLRAEQAAGAPPVQLLAALALAEANDRDAARRVEERLRSALAKEPSIAADALEILLRKARRNDKAAQTQLANLVTATTAPLSARLRAAACLLPTGDENARTLLSQVVAAPGPGQREAAQLLCDADDVSGQPVLRGVLAQTAEPLPARVAAARGLGSCGDNEDVRALAQKLRGGRSAGPLRQAEAGALLRLCSGDPTLLAEQSRGWVELALADGNPQVRAAGAAVLGDLERARVQPLVDKALHDPSAEVRQAAAASLGRSDDGATLGTLANALADDNRGVRLQVWRSIALIVQQLRDDALAKVTVPPALVEALRRSAAQAQGAEQVAAAGALLSAGDAPQRPQVQKGLSSSDADAQELAVDAAAADPELRRSALVRLVEDESQSAALRTRAAIELLRAGDARGLARLRAAADQGGPQGLAAALALLSGDDARSVDAALLAQVRALLDSVEPAVRRTMVSLLARLPLSQAAALLRQLSQDADALVRAQVAQTAAQLRNRPGGRPLATAILRELVDDNDAAVRAQAAALLARVMRRSSRAAETAASSSRESHAAPAAAADGGTPRDGASGEPGGPEPAPATSAAVPAPSPDHADGDAKDQPRRSYLQITAPPDLEFQIDKQPPQTASGKPLEVAPGVHHLTHFGAQHEVAVEPGQTVAVTLSVPAVAQLVRAGMDAFEHKDLRRAKKSLEKAGSLCARKHDERATCNLLAFELSYYLARVYDAQDAWAEAMTEYEKILTPGFPGKVRAADRAAVAAASARLSPRLGRLRVSKLVGGRCQAVNLWMPPGRHRVNVGNGQYVQVRAQETIDIKGCP